MGCLFSYPCLQALRGYGETPKDPVGQNLTAAAVQPEEEKAEVEKPPPTTLNRRKSVSAEAYNPETDEDGGEAKVVHPKSDIQRQRLADVVKNILLFRSLDQEQMQEVLDAMFEKAVQPGEHIIDQGDDGDNFYVIDSGTYDIFVDVDGKPKNVGNYDNAGFFGELALMYNMPRAATIIASSCGTIWALDRTTFRRIVLKTAFQKRKKYETLLESVPLLKSLDLYERMNVADALQSKTFEDGEQIIKQGDAAQMMYFVESGEVRIAMTNKEREDDGSDISDLQEAESCRLSLAENDPSQGEKDVTVVEKGGYFGELALITHQPRAASAYAKGQVKCALLDVEAFERIMGPCMEVLKRNITEYEAQLGQIFGTAVSMKDMR
ncbi:cAMP-dependent protein kinase type II regulatory subunit-like isoform X1 [Babylonia areolata]|uniref:cAMP-dependent protein kinase type II regulatory subunit-like isoform X1 n=2 Tax=Babylonia areolata TaxID=304850 RepID=UPI003FCFD87C